MKPQNLEDFTVGDFIVIKNKYSSLGPRRIAMVTRSKSDDEYVEIMLSHDEAELLSIVDVFIAAEESGLTYDLVVQTDLHSVIWKDQVVKRIGRISSEKVEGILKHSQDPDVVIDGVISGVSIRGFMDPRWAFKENEGRIFRSICSDCVSQVLQIGESIEVTLDVDIFSSEFCDENELYSLLQLIKEKKVLLDDVDRNRIIALGVNKRSYWMSRFPDNGFADVLHSVACEVLKILISTENEIDESLMLDSVSSGRIPSVEPLRNSGKPIVTSPNLWVDFQSVLDSSSETFQLITA
jgi:hypothetical protein